MGYLLPVLSFLLLSAAVSHANLQAQMYWHTVLPNTAMPSAVRDLLHPDDFIDEKTGTSVNIGKGGVIVDSNQFSYYRWQYAPATETQVHHYSRYSFYFMEKDLHSGAKMTLHFTGASNVATFIPRSAAENLPFSTETAPEILSKYSIEPSSAEAEAMKKTISDCEKPAEEEDQNVCATSLESMVDISTAILGTRDLVAASATVGKGAEKEEEYTVAGVRKLAGSEVVACHLVPYVYAVFFCHKTQKTAAYNVEMVGKNGAKVEAVAVCHEDTADWNPEHLAFKVLKVKPGTVPVCHFMPQNHVVWAHANQGFQY